MGWSDEFSLPVGVLPAGGGGGFAIGDIVASAISPGADWAKCDGRPAKWSAALAAKLGAASFATRPGLVPGVAGSRTSAASNGVDTTLFLYNGSVYRYVGDLNVEFTVNNTKNAPFDITSAIGTSYAPRDVIWTGTEFLAITGNSGNLVIRSSPTGAVWTTRYTSSASVDWTNASFSMPNFQSSIILVVASFQAGAVISVNSGSTWANAPAGGVYTSASYVQKVSDGFLFTSYNSGYAARSLDPTGTTVSVVDYPSGYVQAANIVSLDGQTAYMSLVTSGNEYHLFSTNTISNLGSRVTSWTDINYFIPLNFCGVLGLYQGETAIRSPRLMTLENGAWVERQLPGNGGPSSSDLRYPPGSDVGYPPPGTILPSRYSKFGSTVILPDLSRSGSFYMKVA